MRVMLDTNIFISMIFFPSNQTRELAEKLTERHQIIVCDYVVEELRLVTDRKFPAKRKAPTQKNRASGDALPVKASL